MRIKVKDFQSLGNVDIEVKGLTVLVGPSNIGKSAFTRAIQAAMFNRPGEDFIRNGSTQTQVLIDGLPSVTGTPLTVLWQKGHNLNQFTVNGVEYKKVGTGVPPVMISSGYRDVFIGDKERNKGEDIRPQVGGQFDPPFLISKLGSFINDVLSVVSRLGVLLNANGRCAKDLKGQKATLTVRQKDLKVADAKLATLQPIVDLHARTLALQATLDEARRIDALLTKVRTLAATRKALKTFVDATTIPAATVVPDDLGVVTLKAGQDLVRRRNAALHVRELALPKTDTALDSNVHVVVQRLSKVETAAKLLAHRPALVKAAAMAFDKVDVMAFVSTNLDKTQEWVETAAKLTRAIAERDTATNGVYTALSALNGVQDIQAEADAALATALEGMTICPVCEQVMPSKAAAASV